MNTPKRFGLVSFTSIALALCVHAQEDDVLVQDTVVVEGGRTNPMLAGITPEVSLDVAEIRSYGASSLEELLSDLAPLTNSSDGGTPAILLNGRRVTGFREIRRFPPEALARVEILPEEVALKFGFRADQKVINFVLRQRFHALTAQSRQDAPTDGGQWQSEFEISNLRIRNDSRWSLNLDYSYEDALFESDRDIDRGAENAADRSLEPEQQDISLTGSYTHVLPADISATYLAGVDFGKSEASIARSSLTDTLARDGEDWGVEAGVMLDKVYDGWNWTLKSNYAHDNSETETQTDPLTGFAEKTSAETDTASLEAIAFFDIMELPAGNLVTTVQAGASTEQFFSRSDRSGLIEETELSRDELNTQISLDVPILKDGLAGVKLGRLSINANAGFDELSDAGSLSTLGTGVTWRPVNGIQLVASTSRAENAPSLQRLGNAVSVTENASVFDFATGDTVEDVTRITGGNADLQNETRVTDRINLALDPFDETDLTFNFAYTQTETENAITSFPGLTPAIENAFPSRVVRSDDGRLISLDARPINLAQSTNRQVRYGLNWSYTLPRGERPDLDRDERQQLREIFMQRLSEEDRARMQERMAQREAQRANGGGGRGEAGRPGARGGPGRGGPGRGRGDRGGGRGRLFVSVYHTIILEDSLLILDGQERLDLLDGDAISSSGGTPENEVTAQAGFSQGPYGGFLRVSWQDATEINDGNGGRLSFDDLTTTNLRLQYDFGRNPKLLIRYPFLDSVRASFSIDNVFNEKQRVTDAAGLTPINYQPDLLDTQGRTVSLRLRKLFF